MATKQKIAEFKEFVKKNGEIADPEHMPEGWRVSKHQGKYSIGVKIENAFDMSKVNEKIEGIKGDLESKGVVVSPPSYTEDKKLFSILISKMAEDDSGFSHYTQIQKDIVQVTLDAEGIRILELLDKCLIEDKIEAVVTAPVSAQLQKRILIVDDEETVPIMLSRLLSLNKSYSVSIFNNCKAILEEIAENGCDIVITDKDMPVMKGTELADKVKEINSKIPVIMMIGGLSEKEVELFLTKHKSINALILKPFNLDDIKDIIKKLMG